MSHAKTIRSRVEPGSFLYCPALSLYLRQLTAQSLTSSLGARLHEIDLREKTMGRTLIDFAGQYGTPFAVYEAEQGEAGNIKLIKTIFKPHAAQIEFFSATERHVLAAWQSRMREERQSTLESDSDRLPRAG